MIAIINTEVIKKLQWALLPFTLDAQYTYWVFVINAPIFDPITWNDLDIPLIMPPTLWEDKILTHLVSNITNTGSQSMMDPLL